MELVDRISFLIDPATENQSPETELRRLLDGGTYVRRRRRKKKRKKIENNIITCASVGNNRSWVSVKVYQVSRDYTNTYKWVLWPVHWTVTWGSLSRRLFDSCLLPPGKSYGGLLRIGMGLWVSGSVQVSPSQPTPPKSLKRAGQVPADFLHDIIIWTISFLVFHRLLFGLLNNNSCISYISILREGTVSLWWMRHITFDVLSLNPACIVAVAQGAGICTRNEN